MPRCPDCSKFVSYAGGEEPDVESVEVFYDGRVGATVRVHKDCVECGGELKEHQFESEATFDLEKWKDHLTNVLAGMKAEVIGETPDMIKGHELEVEMDTTETTETTSNVDRKGKAVKKAKFAPTLHGFTGEAVVKCSCGEEIDTVTVSDRTFASDFDDLG